MTIENAITKLAEAIELHAKTLKEIYQPLTEIQKEEISEKEEKVEKSKKKIDQAEETLKELGEEAITPEDEEIEQQEESKEEVVKKSEKITHASVKDKAKSIIKSGKVERSKINKMVVDLGGEMIMDLDQKALVKLNDQLDKLQK